MSIFNAHTASQTNSMLIQRSFFNTANLQSLPSTVNETKVKKKTFEHAA
jgi:hypothetical protein